MSDAQDYASRLWQIRMRFLEMQRFRHEELEDLLEEIAGDGFDDRSLSDSQDILHKIAGTAGSVGFPDFGTAARELECMIMDERSRGSIGVDSLCRALDRFLDLSQDLCMDEAAKSA